mgnify:CR=1 FL=1
MIQTVIEYFETISPIRAALYATLFTWAMTAAGAGLVFFFKTMNRAVLDGMLGFTGGVMVAASFWSLLAPGIEMTPGEGFQKVIPAAVGFLLGALFIFALAQPFCAVHQILSRCTSEETTINQKNLFQVYKREVYCTFDRPPKTLKTPVIRSHRLLPEQFKHFKISDILLTKRIHYGWIT